VWSSTNRIAFLRCVMWGGCNSTLFTMNADGSAQAQWVGNGSNGTWSVSAPAWSPDGRAIFYSRSGCQSTGCSSGYQLDLYVTPGLVPGTSDFGTQLTRSDLTETQTTFTPDGKDLLFAQGSGDNLRIATRERILADAGAPDLWPATHPPTGSWPGLGDYLAALLRPILKLDGDEQWRPLDVAQFFAEKNPTTNAPLHTVCDGTCSPVSSAADLARYPAKTATLDVGDIGGVYRSPYAACFTGQVKDCNEGTMSAIYYQPTVRSAGYNYIDYWFFYRYNDIVGGHHEADWEGVTLAAAANAATFDWIAFAQHGHQTSNYLRDILRCDAGGVYSCGSGSTRVGRRVWAYVAGGTHATYPDQCTNGCLQNYIGTIEGDHGGEADWGRNSDPMYTGALQRFPSTSSSNWVDWLGKWGADRAVDSPGNQERFRCPWIGNPGDATACTATARHSRRRADSVAEGARLCSTWFGGSVVALLCSPHQLRRALRKQRLGHRSRMRVTIRPTRRFRSAAAPGVAQGLGPFLSTPTKIHLGARPSRDAALWVRARRGAFLYEVRFDAMGRFRRGWVTLATRRMRGRTRFVLTNGRRTVTGRTVRSVRMPSAATAQHRSAGQHPRSTP
jgi:WD40-like Beta Propeller Repeat